MSYANLQRHGLLIRVFTDDCDTAIEAHLIARGLVDLMFTNCPNHPTRMMYYKFSHDEDELDRIARVIRRASRAKPKFGFDSHKYDPYSNFSETVRALLHTNKFSFEGA